MKEPNGASIALMFKRILKNFLCERNYKVSTTIKHTSVELY